MAFSTSPIDGLVDGDAALLQRPRAHRARSDRSQVGVAPHEREVVDVDAGLGAGDRRPRRVVPLAVRRGAGVDGAGAVVVDLDLGGFVHRRHAARDLDVDADADAEQLGVAGLSPALLLGSQLGVAGLLEGAVEARLVVAAVVGLPHRRGVRLVELGEQVLASHVDGVDAELGGEQVHRPLGRRRRLRTSGAAVGDDRRGVGGDRDAVRLDVGDVVHGGRHAAREQRAEHRADLAEAARVLVELEPEVRTLPSREPPTVIFCNWARP